MSKFPVGILEQTWAGETGLNMQRCKMRWILEGLGEPTLSGPDQKKEQPVSGFNNFSYLKLPCHLSNELSVLSAGKDHRGALFLVGYPLGQPRCAANWSQIINLNTIFKQLLS